MTARQSAGAAPDKEDLKWKRIEETRRKRQERGPIDPMLGMMKLSIPEERKDKDFEYRWVNDTPMRVASLEARDWELVNDMTIASDARNSSTGTRIERIVDERTVNTPKTGFLMRKYKEFYDEDERRKETAIDKGEEAIKHGNLPHAASTNGRGLTEADKMYIPKEGINIRHAGKRR
jgi:hypothetical protein